MMYTSLEKSDLLSKGSDALMGYLNNLRKTI